MVDVFFSIQGGRGDFKWIDSPIRSILIYGIRSNVAWTLRIFDTILGYRNNDINLCATVFHSMVANCAGWCIACPKIETRSTLQNHKRWRGKAQNKKETFGFVCKSVTYET